MKQIAMELGEENVVNLESGLVMITGGEYRGEIVFYDCEDDETEMASCYLQVPEGHLPYEILVEHENISPLTDDEIAAFVHGQQGVNNANSMDVHSIS